MSTPQTPAVLTSQDRSGNSFRVVAMTLASLVPDGQRLGAQIADIAIAALGGSRPPALTLDFLLDGRQFPVQ